MDEHYSAIKKQNIEELRKIKSYTEARLDGTVSVLQGMLKGDPMTDEEIEECLTVLKFTAKVCKMRPEYGLMKRDIHSEIERLERIQMFRNDIHWTKKL